MPNRKPLAFALLAVAFGVFLFLFLRRPAPVPPKMLHPTRKQAAQAERHFETVQQQIRQAEAPEISPPPGQPMAAPLRPRRPITLRLSEDDLNVYLSGNKSAHTLLAAHGVKALQLILSEPAGLTIRAAVSVKGHSQNIQIDGSLTPDPKLGLRYTAAHAQAGRFPLPPAIITAQANALAARIAGQMQSRLPLAIQSVQVQGKMLVLIGLPTRRKAAKPRLIKPPAPVSPPPMSPAHR